MRAKRAPSVAVPMSYRVAHVAGEQIVRMFSIQRDHAEHIHVLIEDDDFFRRLNDLLRKESEHYGSRYTRRQATRCWIVDSSAIEGF